MLLRSGCATTGKTAATIDRATVFAANALEAKIVYAWAELGVPLANSGRS